MSNLGSWSWNDIQRVYRALGVVLRHYEDAADRFELKLPMDKPLGQIIMIEKDFYDPQRTDFIRRWYLGVTRTNKQLNALDQEIKRRNGLIGIMG